MTETLCPKGEQVWVTYYKGDQLLFFLAGPENMTFTMTAQSDKFTLYGVTVTKAGKPSAKKLGSGGNPPELEAKYGVTEKLKEK